VVLEGPDLVVAALDAGVELEAVYFEAAAWTPRQPACSAALARAEASGVELVELDDGVLERVADARSPQPVLGVAAMPPSGLATIPPRGFVLVLSDVNDPGNLGTAIRSADASGASAVVVCGESVDVFNPKTLRATAGSVFQIAVAIAPALAEVTAALRSSGRVILGAVVDGGQPLWTASLAHEVAVVVGAESRGLDDEDRSLLDGMITIEMAGRAESLNVGVAAALVCFESLRQRRANGGLDAPAPTI
jgi:TrmH family RNA methyltransferase